MSNTAMRIGFVLVDPSARYHRSGPGFRPLDGGLDLARLPLSADRQGAARAAKALRRAIGLSAVPAPLRLAGRP